MVQVKWCSTSVILALQFICYVESIRDTSETTVTACTGRCSYQYSLQCPSSKKIALHKLEYASKEVSIYCPNVQEPCQDKRQCCSYNAGDCRIPFADSVAFPVYTKCSGKQQCDGLRAKQISTVSRCSSRDVSNYVAATYTCEDDNTFVDMCSNDTIYGKAINLILNGSQSTSHPGFQNSNLCACVISTSDCDSDARLRFQAVDVRLHKNQDITDCHPHSVIEITDGQYGSRPFSYKCQSNLFRRGLIDHYYSRAPYARISMYNKPELNISQIWLRISATFPDVDVMITCGSGAMQRSLQNVCVPPEFYPTTTPNIQPSTYDLRPHEDKDPNPGNIEKETDVIPIVAGVVAGLVVVVLIIIVVCCRRRRRLRKKQEDRFSHSLTITAPPLPSPEDNVYDEYEAGNYYDSVENGRKYPTSPFKPATPGKNMGSFFPTEPKKVSPPVLPPPLPVVPPTVPAIPPTGPVVPLSPLVSSPTVSKSPASENSYDKDANPYQQPWDGKPLLMPNRRKKSDLAYATSDEIQVLIQRMDNERRKLNEGDTCTSPTGFIHIDDYKLSQSMREEDIDEKDEENNESEEEEGEDDSKKLLGQRHSVNIPDDRHLPEHVHIDPHDVMCSSEDTGYRSVGSQEHILVSEDDYLVPGSVKGKKEESNLPQRLSSQSSVKRDKCNRSSVSEEKRNVNGETMSGEAYAEVYDALEEGKTVDVKTKF